MKDDDHFYGLVPPDFDRAMQFFDGETEERAIRQTAVNFEVPRGDVIALPGRYPFDCDWERDRKVTCEFRPDGWTTFVRIPPMCCP